MIRKEPDDLQPQRREHPSTYFVQDRSSLDEMTRLHIQDQMLTASMGGVLPEQPDPTIFQTVLDVGCGTGDWLIEAAKTYPTMTRLVGVDISTKMLDHAREQAQTEGVSDRIEFVPMDALRMLEFRDNTFDLVNHRLGVGWVRKWEWPKLVSEYYRVCKAGRGVLRITEGNYGEEHPSQAYMQFGDILLKAFYNAGNYFTFSQDSLTREIPELLKRYGLLNIQSQTRPAVYRSGTPEGNAFYENTKYLVKTSAPFLRKWTEVPEQYDALCQQLLSDIQQPDFVATWQLITTWGTVPTKKEKPKARD